MKIAKLFYRTSLQGLNKTLHKFDKQELMRDISYSRDFYDEALENLNFPYNYRIKSLESCRIKYDRYYPNYTVERTFNDIFSARIIINNYQDAYDFTDTKPSRESNMINGKKMMMVIVACIYTTSLTILHIPLSFSSTLPMTGN